MKNPSLIYIVFVLLFMAFSCKKEYPVPEVPVVEEPDTSALEKYEMIWQIPIYPDSIVTSSDLGNSMYNGNFLFLRDKEWGGIHDLLYIDGKTGAQIWMWNDYLHGKVIGLSGVFENGNYYTSGIGEYYCINMESGVTQWSIDFEGNKSVGGNLNMGEFIYGTSRSWTNFVSEPDKGSIVKIEKSTGIVYDIFSIEKTDDYTIRLSQPSVWINDQNDTILVFQNRQYRLSPYKDKADIYSYNMTQDAIMWMLEDYGDGILSNAYPLVVDEDRVYFLNARTMYCLDKYTGETLWSKSYNTTFLCSNYLVVDDKIIYGSCEGHLVILDKLTGEELYFVEDGSAIFHITYHDGRLYYINGSIKIIDVNTGKKLYDIKTPNKSADNYFTGRVLLNEELGYMYAHDYYFLMCMKIPE